MTGFRIAAIVVLACLVACSKQPASRPKDASLASVAYPASSSDGGRVYLTNCSSCHQTDGQGVAGAFPPLVHDAVVTGPPKRVIAIVALGSRGAVRAGGGAYDGVMPGWKGLISDDDIAAVVTYIRSAWNNHASAVSAADVEALSARNR